MSDDLTKANRRAYLAEQNEINARRQLHIAQDQAAANDRLYRGALERWKKAQEENRVLNKVIDSMAESLAVYYSIGASTQDSAEDVRKRVMEGITAETRTP